MPKEYLGMYGERLEKLVCIKCRVCGRWRVVRIDPDDLDRHVHGIFVQHAFVRRDGTPYLDSSERELFISSLCKSCWDLLCPDPIARPTFYN
jgi:Na+-translocating ferredoxin:NAD+ oxidoreductase RnfC subunit